MAAASIKANGLIYPLAGDCGRRPRDRKSDTLQPIPAFTIPGVERAQDYLTEYPRASIHAEKALLKESRDCSCAAVACACACCCACAVC